MPYSILKVLKQYNRPPSSASVLCPTALSRFSSAIFGVDRTSIVLYPTALSRFSSSFEVLSDMYKFCALQHSQGFQTGVAQKNSDIVLYPTTFSRFSSFMHNQFDKLYVLYSTTFSRFSSAVIDTVYAKWFCTIQHYQGSQTDGVYRSGMHVLYPIAFSRFSSSGNIQQCCQQFCTLQHPQGSQTSKKTLMHTAH